MQVERTTILTGDASGSGPAWVRSSAACGDGKNWNLEHRLAGVGRTQATLETEEAS